MTTGPERAKAVVVIDDDPDFRELVEIFVSTWGLRCVQAPDGPSSLPLLERERGHLRAVILDYFMPGLEPRACAHAVRDRVEPGVPVILVSAAVDIADRAAELGLTQFLAKPFEMDQLHDLVVGRP